MNQPFDKKEAFAAWAEKFLKAKQSPMSEPLSRAFISCSFGEKQVTFPPDGVRTTLAWRIAEVRAAGYGLKITDALMAFIAVLAEGRPGTVVMYCALLRYVQLKRNLPLIGMDEFAFIFPVGYPNEQVLGILWDSQKGHVLGGDFDNLLDKIGEITEV